MHGLVESKRNILFVLIGIGDALDDGKESQSITVILAGHIIIMTLNASKHGVSALPLDNTEKLAVVFFQG